MTKRELTEKILRHIPEGAKLWIEVEPPQDFAKTRWWVAARCSDQCFPIVWRSNGVSTVRLICRTKSKKAARKQAEQFVKWARELDIETELSE